MYKVTQRQAFYSDFCEIHVAEREDGSRWCLKAPKRSPGAEESFGREVEAVRRLRSIPELCPYILIPEEEEFEGGTALVTPFVEVGVPDRISREQTLKMIRELTQAIAFLRRHGLVHDDIHTRNIAFHQGVYQLMDWGCAGVSNRYVSDEEQLLTMFEENEQKLEDPGVVHRWWGSYQTKDDKTGLGDAAD